MEALKQCDTSPEVICAVARLFARDRKIDKARKWFERAVTLQPKYGDAWAHYYAFELRQSAGPRGDTTRAEALPPRCLSAAPNRGEEWCTLAKRTDMRHKDAATVLRTLAQDLLLRDRVDRESEVTELQESVFPLSCFTHLHASLHEAPLN